MYIDDIKHGYYKIFGIATIGMHFKVHKILLVMIRNISLD